jgi:hypothetical protein
MRSVDHLVVLLRRAVGRLEQRPDVVEEIDGELTTLRLRELRLAVAGLVAHGPRSYVVPSFELHQQGDAAGLETADAFRVSANDRNRPCPT